MCTMLINSYYKPIKLIQSFLLTGLKFTTHASYSLETIVLSFHTDVCVCSVILQQRTICGCTGQTMVSRSLHVLEPALSVPIDRGRFHRGGGTALL